LAQRAHQVLYPLNSRHSFHRPCHRSIPVSSHQCLNNLASSLPWCRQVCHLSCHLKDPVPLLLRVLASSLPWCGQVCHLSCHLSYPVPLLLQVLPWHPHPNRRINPWN
jgi:hypothetical protein